MGSDTEGESATVKKAESVAQPGRAIKIVVPAIILLPLIVAIISGYSTLSIGNWFRLCCVMALAVFLPIMAYSYFFFRKQRREAEVKRIIDILDIPEDSDYFAIYKSINSGPYLFLACGLATTISLIGLGILFQGANIGVDDMELFVLDGHRFPKKNSMLILGMAFLGAYLWGLNYIFERYSRNDLSPGAFYTLSI